MKNFLLHQAATRFCEGVKTLPEIEHNKIHAVELYHKKINIFRSELLFDNIFPLGNYNE